MTTKECISIFRWGVVLVIAILLFMFWRGCKNEGKGIKTPDTVAVKIDTFWMPLKSDTFYTPAVVKTKYVPKYKTDTLEWTEYINVDTANIFKDYLATRYYQDSLSVQYGRVYINDTVNQNKIISRGVKTSFNIPVVKETVTINRPRRNIAYIGFGAMGSEQSFLEQTEISFGFKVKNDKYYGIKGAMSRTGNVLAGIEFKIPIRLKKQ